MKSQCICTQLEPQDSEKTANEINKLEATHPLRAAFFTKKLWDQNTTITVSFLNSNPSVFITPLNRMKDGNSPIDPIQKEFFEEYAKEGNNINIVKWIKLIIMKRIQPLVNLKFQFVDYPNPAMIRIDFEPVSGSYSMVGQDALLYVNNENTVNFGWFDVGTVIHEMGHVLGLIHEHQNPKGASIPWNKKKLYSYMAQTQGWDKSQVNANIVDKYDQNQINGSSFDPLSIMEYFYPASLTRNKTEIKPNLRLSGNDVVYISKNYPKPDVTAEKLNDLFEGWYGQSIEENQKQSQQLAKQLAAPLSTADIIAICVCSAVVVGLAIFLIIYFVRRK